MSENKQSGGRALRRCSFCGRTEQQVNFLIPGPNGVYICDVCIDACNQIIEEQFESESEGINFELAELPKPKDIKKILFNFFAKHRKPPP